MQEFQNTSRFSILLPDSLLTNEDTLLLKTRKLGQILRTVTMFRIQQLYFYNDSGSSKDKKILHDIMTYMLDPPYLRKYHPSLPNLRYTAILPPLHAPSHIGLQHEVSTFLAGKVVSSNKSKVRIDIGKKNLIEISHRSSAVKGDNVIVKTNNQTHFIELVQFTPGYWKTEFHISNATIEEFLRKNTDFFVIGATRSGQQLNCTILQTLQSQNKQLFLIIFGPIRGSLKGYIKNHELVDKWINFIPSQGTKTVKIEEALHSSLSILNIVSLNVK